MRIATWNIHRGRPAFGRFRPDRILAVLAELRPDLIALQEAQHYLRRVTPMLPEAALAELGLVPLRPDPAQQGYRSNLVLVRRDTALLAPPRGLRLGGWEPRGAILADLDLGTGPFRLLAAHLSLGAATRRAQARLLLAAMHPEWPSLLLGDLNEWRPQGSALGVLAAAMGPVNRLPTFPSFRPLLPLDHILARPAAGVAGLAVHDTPAARRASDHLPLVASLAFLWR
ncbi:endonuclease/exonuclease/phosphatase family protein [Falsiroseomonas tokyonensis]|uniref:Endonuclease/exonuclease/phosphatase family protein n=1 Tax=Falsiroseomonas tokyonensis TaxID=430521 RepID=A0ABV7BVW5_9PROT|nr:endonuclease/exonuclease/phosphatase family protein [Falsiroseomonas tokyonensis]MBU8539828.1 endonuclease/exonuclease/phosphatase family protein [Falsiroseomonas tokyonensis]